MDLSISKWSGNSVKFISSLLYFGEIYLNRQTQNILPKIYADVCINFTSNLKNFCLLFNHLYSFFKTQIQIHFLAKYGSDLTLVMTVMDFFHLYMSNLSMKMLVVDDHS